jgi:hypothetical protein
MSKGYQIVEPRALDELIREPRNRMAAVAVLSWVCEMLRLELQNRCQRVEFEVINVTYLGSYPAIGIHYLDKDPQDIGPIVQATVDRILQERSALELISFIAQENADWHQKTAKLFS